MARLEKRLAGETGEEKVDTLNLLGFYFSTRSPNRSITYLQQALKLSEEIKYDKGKAKAFIHLANAERVLGKIREPFRYTRQALDIYRRLGDQGGEVNALNTIGYLYRSIDSYDEALKCLLQAMEICDRIDARGKKAGIQYQLGNLYLRLDKPRKALEYFEHALSHAERSENQRLMSSCLNNIGLAYRNQGQYQKALDYFKRTLDISIELEDPYIIAGAAGNTGYTYGQLNNFPKALEYLHKAVKAAEGNNNRKGICDNLTHIGDQYFKQKNYTQAVDFFEKALKIALEINDNSSVQNINGSLADLYIARKDYKKALDHYKKSVEVKDRINDSQKNRQLLELQERYEAERRAREIEILQRKNKIKTITRNVFIAGFILVLLLLVIIFKKYLYLFAFWKKEKYIGQYRLIKTLGIGGMGTVFKAYSIRDKDRLVAVKVLKEELSRRESNRRRFKLEGTIIDKLDHPNVIKIFERGEYHEKLFIVMEYVEGETLAERIERVGSIPLADCRDIMKQITAALVFIHRANIIHRDLKPDNIMITGKEGAADKIKLLDFGLSKMKFQSRITMTGMLVGTANYMAPEQISDLESSPASDIFSLGLIFYEMLTGRTAFSGESLTRIEKEILGTMPAAPEALRPDIPGELNELIMEMLAKSPEQRPSAESVSERLDF